MDIQESPIAVSVYMCDGTFEYWTVRGRSRTRSLHKFTGITIAGNTYEELRAGWTYEKVVHKSDRKEAKLKQKEGLVALVDLVPVKRLGLNSGDMMQEFI